MAELKILGVKRVEALLAVLEQKEKEEIAALDIPSSDAIKAMVDAEFGLTEKRAKEAEFREKLSAVIAELNEAIGEDRCVSISYNYRSKSKTSAYERRRNELVKELREKPIEDVKQAYKTKRTQLRLCDTIEAAKAVVGIE